MQTGLFRGVEIGSNINGMPIGDPRFADFFAAAEELGAPVTFLGRIPNADLPPLYGCADVFAMLCRNRWGGLEQEGFGIVFLEAAACGVAGVAGAFAPTAHVDWLLMIAAIGAVATNQALSLAAKLPEYRANISKKIRAVREPQGVQAQQPVLDDVEAVVVLAHPVGGGAEDPAGGDHGLSAHGPVAEGEPEDHVEHQREGERADGEHRHADELEELVDDDGDDDDVEQIHPLDRRPAKHGLEPVAHGSR